MFLEMKDIDFFPSLIKFYPNLTNLSKFCPNWPKFFAIDTVKCQSHLSCWLSCTHLKCERYLFL